MFQVAFSDESLFQAQPAGYRKQWQPPKSPPAIRPVHRHPVKVMVWSLFCMQGTGRLHIVEGNMNKEQYLHVLRTRMAIQMREWFPNGDGIFMHDRAPCHTARVCSQYLQDEGFQVLDWPGNSPDLNPIENLWGIIKNKLQGSTITTRGDLICQVIKIWHRDASIPEYLNNLVASMPHRLQQVIDLKGGFTKY